MTPNFLKAYKELGQNEGGFKCEPEDRMDWTGGQIGVGELRGTNHGISAGTYPHLDIKNLTSEDAQKLYYQDFWLRFKGDEYPYELAFQIFDSEVNHGKTMGIRFLQRAAGVKDDGVVGSITLGRVRLMDEDKIIMRFLAVRMRYFTAIKTWDKYGRGWANRVANLLMVATE